MPLNPSMGMGRSKLNVQLALPESSTFDVKCMGNQRCKEIFSALNFFSRIDPFSAPIGRGKCYSPCCAPSCN